MNTWDNALAALLRDATRVAVLDDDAAIWLAEHAPQIIVERDRPHCDLALGISALCGLDAAAARFRLFHARTYLAPSVIVVARADCSLCAADFRALAFEPLATDATATLYQFNLATYKPVPDWLNSRYWAHPENWDK